MSVLLSHRSKPRRKPAGVHFLRAWRWLGVRLVPVLMTGALVACGDHDLLVEVTTDAEAADADATPSAVDSVEAANGTDAALDADTAATDVGATDAEGADAFDSVDSEDAFDGGDAAVDVDVAMPPDAAEVVDVAPDTGETPDVAAPDVVTDDATLPSDVTTAADAGLPLCTVNADCLPSAGLAPCQVALCTAGVCSLTGAADGSPCEDGNACTHADVCLSGQCTQGLMLDCDDGLPCTIDTCVQGGCAHSPASGPCDDGNTCTLGDSCKVGVCVAGQLLDCEDGNVCTDNPCVPGVGCTQTPNSAPCTLLDLCQTGAQCGDGTCQAGVVTVCDDGNPCTNDLCDPQTGLCQFLETTTPCDDGNACSIGDLCAGGACQPGAGKSCDDGSPCTADGCDSTAGVCLHTAASGACNDGSACTVDDTCAGGVCLPGAATNCDDNNPCTNDTCDAQAGCTHTDNALACSVGDGCELAQCQNGQCVTTGVKGCDDGNPCTVGTCVAPMGCVFTPVADGATCSTADACTGAGSCSVGKCQTGAKTDCSDGNSCTDDHCDPTWVKGCYWLPNAEPCEDGDMCSGQDACSNGKCVPGAITSGTNCDDANVCTDDSCDSVAGCVHSANAAACDDGNACTVFEKCASGVCQGGALATCEDGNLCTIDVCAPGSGTCSWYPKLGGCDDGNPCTTAEVCVNAACVGTAVPCDDGNPCSADACDVTSGVCGHTPIGVATPCDDGDACTNNDACVGLSCGGASVAASLCNDGNVCTVDVCNPVDGTCSWAPAVSSCDDANPCTVGDACAAGICAAGTVALCDDNNACTTDQCNPATGACAFVSVSDGTVCDDGIACTTDSVCHVGLCAPAVASCTLFSDAFACGESTVGWSLPAPTNTAVVWAVDQSPVLSNSAAHGCTLNYNDGATYCSSTTSFYCPVAPTLVAKSPAIDATEPHGVPRLAFDTWYQLDGPLPGGTGFGDGKQDVPLVVLRDVATNQVLDQFLLSKSISACNGQCQSVWRGVSLDEPKVAGHIFRVEFSLASPSNWGNQGKGWFVDNLNFSQEFVPESCANGLDDDGNGRVDCADPACVDQPGC